MRYDQRHLCLPEAEALFLLKRWRQEHRPQVGAYEERHAVRPTALMAGGGARQSYTTPIEWIRHAPIACRRSTLRRPGYPATTHADGRDPARRRHQRRPADRRD